MQIPHLEEEPGQSAGLVCAAAGESSHRSTFHSLILKDLQTRHDSSTVRHEAWPASRGEPVFAMSCSVPLTSPSSRSGFLVLVTSEDGHLGEPVYLAAPKDLFLS